jgi:thioesterase domain-containing protein
VTATPDCLIPIRTTGSRPPLFCVHPISGSAYVYMRLARTLAVNQPIYGLEAPGFDDERAPLTTVPELSQEYLRRLRHVCPDGRYCLLGWSMGGAIAFDMAHRLLAERADVQLLVVIDSPVPEQLPLPPERVTLGRFLYDFMCASGASPSTAMSRVDAGLARLGRDASVETLLQDVSTLLPPELEPDFLRHRYGVFRANVNALSRYSVPGTLPGRVVTIRATATPDTARPWSDVATEVVAHVIGGNHYSIWAGEGLQAMGQILERHLANPLPGGWT